MSYDEKIKYDRKKRNPATPTQKTSSKNKTKIQKVLMFNR